MKAGLLGEGTSHLDDTLCFKTHWPVITAPREPEFERAIVVVRHPAHAALSYAAYTLSSTMSHDNAVGEEQMREHMASPSLRSLANRWHYYLWIFSSYSQAWISRIKQLGPEGALLVRYEDLKSDCPRELLRMIRFLGVRPSESAIACACRTASLSTTHRRRRPYEPADVVTASDLSRMEKMLAEPLAEWGYESEILATSKEL